MIFNELCNYVKDSICDTVKWFHSAINNTLFMLLVFYMLLQLKVPVADAINFCMQIKHISINAIHGVDDVH